MKALLLIAVCVMLVPLALSVLYLITGSLEVEPTAQQEEKARITGFTGLLVFSLVEIFLLVLLRRAGRTVSQQPMAGVRAEKD